MKHKPPAAIKIVVLDFNGTVLRDTDTYVDINVQVGKAIGLQGLTAERFKELAGTPGQDWKHAFRVVATEEGNNDVIGMINATTETASKEVPTLRSKFQEIYTQRMRGQKAIWDFSPDLILTPGCLEGIKALRQKGIQVDIISNQVSDQLFPMLEQAGVMDVLSRGDIFGGADKVAGIRQAAEKNGVPIEQVLFVSDERRDLDFAREAGSQFAHVSTGVNTKQEVMAHARQSGATPYFINSVADVPELVNQIEQAVANNQEMSVDLTDQSAGLETPALALAAPAPVASATAGNSGTSAA